MRKDYAPVKRKRLTGVYTAIVTPFRDGKIDSAGLERLVKSQIRGGVDGVVPVGTTGESPTLSYEEHIRVIELTVQCAAGRIAVVAGTGGNSTDEAVYLTSAAQRVGADASLQVAPYYNKPTQEGLFEHFRVIAEATRLPIMLYSIPGRCGVEIGIDTVQRLAHACRNVVGIKEAGGNADRISALRAALGPRFVILSGDDSLTLPFMAVGAEGVVSVASNLVPREVTRMVRAFAAGRLAEAQKWHARLYPLFKDLFVETNPIPVKAALAMLGGIEEELRLPLVRLSESNRTLLRATLERCGVLQEATGKRRRTQPKQS
jgi:4-hydroxy-tetrahydrodipicolinate synthase